MLIPDFDHWAIFRKAIRVRHAPSWWYTLRTLVVLMFVVIAFLLIWLATAMYESANDMWLRALWFSVRMDWAWLTMMFSQPGNVLGIFGVTLLLSHLLLGYYLVAAVHDYFLRRRLFTELVDGVARLRYIGQVENEVVYSLTDTRGSRYELRCHSNPAESAAPK